MAAADADTFLSLVDALADYEKLERPSSDARERLKRDALGPPPRIQVYIAEIGGVPAGYALTFDTYSSFLALPTLYLEDLFVLPDFRRQGVARELFRFLAGEAVRRGCGRMEWAVLDWNGGAIDFYETIGARRIREWLMYRLTTDQLKELAAPVPSGDQKIGSDNIPFL